MAEKAARAQRWSLTTGGQRHQVEAVDVGMSRRIEWLVDGSLVATKKSAEDKLTLRAGDGVETDAQHGSLELRFTMLGKGRRATLHPTALPVPGAGVDLEPEPGSPAAAYEERVRRHPRRYAVQAVVVSVLTVVLPLLLGLLAIRFAFSLSLPWPDLPSLPRPNLPDLPLPSLPDVSLPDWSLPAWVHRVLDALRYVWPVALAFVLARAEIRRRRKQDELRAARNEELESDRD